MLRWVEDNVGAFESFNQPYDERPWLTIKHLLNRPWWSRVWVVQESTAHMSTYMFCGTKTVSWLNMIIAVLAILASKWKPGCDILNDLPIVRATKLRELQESRRVGVEELNLINLLPRFHQFDASDPRDKVFTILGLAGDIDHSSILKADYSKSFRDTHGCSLTSDIYKRLWPPA